MNTLYITPTTYFIMNSTTLSLYVNGILAQQWIQVPLRDDSLNTVADDSLNQIEGV